jgi:hypothetical protein
VIDRPPDVPYIRRHIRTLIPYLLAAAAYIFLGVLDQRFLLSWAEGILFVFLAVWAVPWLWRRYRR